VSVFRDVLVGFAVSNIDLDFSVLVTNFRAFSLVLGCFEESQSMDITFVQEIWA
jgi:hypothetical protein